MNATKLAKKCEQDKQGVVDNKVFQHVKDYPELRKAYKHKFLKAFLNAIDPVEFLEKHNYSRERYKAVGIKHTDSRSFSQLLIPSEIKGRLASSIMLKTPIYQGNQLLPFAG